MMTRRAVWTVSGLGGVVLLAVGLWAGRQLPTDTATPDVQTGVVSGVSIDGGGFAIRLSGEGVTTGYPLGSALSWRDKYGIWHDESRPACLKPLTHGQHVTIGVVRAQPSGDVPSAAELVVWVECARVPVPRFPIVTPRSSGPP